MATLPKHIKSGGTPTIGWGTSADVTYGIVQTEATSLQGMIRELRNHVGQVIVKLIYDKGTQKRIRILLDATKTAPEFGDTVTWDTKHYLCEGSEVAASNEDFTALDITLTQNEGITLA